MAEAYKAIEWEGGWGAKLTPTGQFQRRHDCGGQKKGLGHKKRRLKRTVCCICGQRQVGGGD